MQRIKPAIIILLAIPVAILVSHLYLRRATESMSQKLDAAISLAHSGDAQGAADKAEEFHRQWYGSKPLIATFIRHYELDVVNLSDAKLSQFIENGDLSDFCAECETLKVQLEHIWESERISLENIL